MVLPAEVCGGVEEDPAHGLGARGGVVKREPGVGIGEHARVAGGLRELNNVSSTSWSFSFSRTTTWASAELSSRRACAAPQPAQLVVPRTSNGVTGFQVPAELKRLCLGGGGTTSAHAVPEADEELDGTGGGVCRLAEPPGVVECSRKACLDLCPLGVLGGQAQCHAQVADRLVGGAECAARSAATRRWPIARPGELTGVGVPRRSGDGVEEVLGDDRASSTTRSPLRSSTSTTARCVALRSLREREPWAT